VLASRNRAQLLIVDVQTRLAPQIAGREDIEGNVRTLAKAAATLRIPVTLTEHYASGLGATVAAVREAAGASAVTLDKIEFSCLRNPRLKERLEGLAREGREEIVIAGMEAHVCVMQTALDLRAAGHHVFLVADAAGSQAPASRELAIERMREAGVVIASTAMIVFEWLERADTPEFRTLLPLLKRSLSRRAG